MTVATEEDRTALLESAAKADKKVESREMLQYRERMLQMGYNPVKVVCAKRDSLRTIAQIEQFIHIAAPNTDFADRMAVVRSRDKCEVGVYLKLDCWMADKTFTFRDGKMVDYFLDFVNRTSHSNWTPRQELIERAILTKLWYGRALDDALDIMASNAWEVLGFASYENAKLSLQQSQLNLQRVARCIWETCELDLDAFGDGGKLAIKSVNLEHVRWGLRDADPHALCLHAESINAPALL